MLVRLDKPLRLMRSQHSKSAVGGRYQLQSLVTQSRGSARSPRAAEATPVDTIGMS
jgi:hypothetical protein